MRFLRKIVDVVLVLADAVYARYEAEQKEWESQHDAQQLESVRKAYPHGWQPPQ